MGKGKSQTRKRDAPAPRRPAPAAPQRDPEATGEELSAEAAPAASAPADESPDDDLNELKELLAEEGVELDAAATPEAAVY